MDRIERYKIEDLKNIPSKKIYTNFGEGNFDVVELHVFGGEDLLVSDHNIEDWRIDRYIKNKVKRDRPTISLNIHKGIRKLGLHSGNYKIQYNFFRNILGSHEKNNGIYIAEVSPSRTEIRVKTSSKEKAFLDDFSEFAEKDTSAFVDSGWQDLMLNFGNNNIVLAINWLDDDEGGIIFKLYEPLPDELDVKDQLWVVKEIITSHTEIIKLFPAKRKKPGIEIAPPNFETQFSNQTTGDSKWETWDTILGSNGSSGAMLGSRQELLNKFISGSSAIKNALLNIDYREFNNFVHFSSAEERLQNFKYKMGLLEYYDMQIHKIYPVLPYDGSGASGSRRTNIIDYKQKKNAVITGFDGYEKYLYFENHSYESSSLGIYTKATWPKWAGATEIAQYNSYQSMAASALIQSSYVIPRGQVQAREPWPNRIQNDTVVKTWFNAKLVEAKAFDRENIHNLENTIPFHIREDKANSHYLLFVNMIAHHFDELFNYIETTKQIHSRENKLYEGLSKDLVYNVLSSLGWESYQGFHYADLWEYALGVGDDNTTGLSLKGSNVTSSAAIEHKFAYSGQGAYPNPKENLSRETWKRMLNNLPYLLKTKGSERGIRALLTTYGLPPTLLRIFEYGGPQKKKTTDSYVIYDKFNYSLDFQTPSASPGTYNSIIQIPHLQIDKDKHPLITSHQHPDAIEMRFNCQTPGNYILWNKTGNNTGLPLVAVFMEKHTSASSAVSGYKDYGRLWLSVFTGGNNYTSCNTAWAPIYDNDWWNFTVSTMTASMAATNGLKLSLAKSPDYAQARVIHTSSAQINGLIMASAWDNTVVVNPTYIGNAWKTSLTTAPWANLIASTGITPEPLEGSIQEYRSWVFQNQVAVDKWNSLVPFHNHTRAPLSIEGTSWTSSYDELVVRYPFGADLNRYSSSWNNPTGDYTAATNTYAQGITAQFNSIISSSHPSVFAMKNPWKTTATSTEATGANFWGSAGTASLINDWPTEEGRHYTPMPDLISTRTISDKIRIESSTLRGMLDPFRKVEESHYDKAPLDSNRLGIYFAPNFNIDLDIAHDIGGVKFDDYVGNPLDYGDNEYKALRPIRLHYWKKHLNPYSFFDYLKIIKQLDHTLFKQIEHLVPARANAQIGLLVQGNMLERPKVKSLGAVKSEPMAEGALNINNYIIKANTTVVGGVFHKWLNPLNNKWETGSAIQAYTGFATMSRGSVHKSVGEVEVRIDMRNHYGYDLDNNGSRYIWNYMPVAKIKTDNVSSNTPYWKHNTTASMQIGGASYENGGTFYHNKLMQTPYWNQLSTNPHTSSVAGYSPGGIVGHSASLHKTGSYLLAHGIKDINDSRYKKVAPFNDFGNIKYYHHQTLSRRYHKDVFYYMAPMNNTGTSASSGGHPSAIKQLNGFNLDVLQNGWYRSGLMPVSRSSILSEKQEFLPSAWERTFYSGCKLIGSDFNMPVMETIDGGPVVEFTDTNPNKIVISQQSSAEGDIQSTGGTIEPEFTR